MSCASGLLVGGFTGKDGEDGAEVGEGQRSASLSNAGTAAKQKRWDNPDVDTRLCGWHHGASPSPRGHVGPSRAAFVTCRMGDK